MEFPSWLGYVEYIAQVRYIRLQFLNLFFLHSAKIDYEYEFTKVTNGLEPYHHCRATFGDPLKAKYIEIFYADFSYLSIY